MDSANGPPRNSEEEARAALLELHAFLTAIPPSAPDYRNASHGAALVAPFLSDPIDGYFYHSLCGTLSKGIGDWSWTEAVWGPLDALMNKAVDKTHQHIQQS